MWSENENSCPIRIAPKRTGTLCTCSHIAPFGTKIQRPKRSFFGTYFSYFEARESPTILLKLGSQHLLEMVTIAPPLSPALSAQFFALRHIHSIFLNTITPLNENALVRAQRKRMWWFIDKTNREISLFHCCDRSPSVQFELYVVRTLYSAGFNHTAALWPSSST